MNCASAIIVMACQEWCMAFEVTSVPIMTAKVQTGARPTAGRMPST